MGATALDARAGSKYRHRGRLWHVGAGAVGTNGRLADAVEPRQDHARLPPCLPPVSLPQVSTLLAFPHHFAVAAAALWPRVSGAQFPSGSLELFALRVSHTVASKPHLPPPAAKGTVRLNEELALTRARLAARQGARPRLQRGFCLAFSQLGDQQFK